MGAIIGTALVLCFARSAKGEVQREGRAAFSHGYGIHLLMAMMRPQQSET